MIENAQAPPPPNLRLRLDGAALAANWRTLNGLSGTAQAGAAVKADAYGTGVDFAVPVLREAGCRHFFVAHWGEVAPVLAHAAAEHVFVLHGPLSAEDAHYARATGVCPVINSVEQAQVWKEAGGGACALMLDSGINRLGISTVQLNDPAIAALDVTVFMSHLASADEDCAQNVAQLEAFRSARHHFPDALHSLANSAGIALGAHFAFDLTRPGLALYGGVPRAALAENIRQVAYPQAQIIQVRDIAAGDRVGYNGTFIADRPMQVGTVCLGYADGFLRFWGGAGYLGLQGQRLPILGKVSMDMVVVDLTDNAELTAGDWLDIPYRLPDAARMTGLSQYELLTLLGRRFDRSA